VPFIPFYPVGTGVYGDFVRARLKERGIVSEAPSPAEENGCCYCLVEPDGERTFICYHGAEYRFQPGWFDQLDASQIDTVYLCGLEVEEPDGHQHD
jgi:sugar/nucleoside kinase (ribokinase family)